VKSLLRYRTVIYAGTLLTGATGLVYQVVWQKYLSFIVGSETRSVSLVVAVFLGGLAAGYHFWGRASERAAERRKLLRLYGAIELGIGAYAALFPLYVQLLTSISQRAPSGFLTDTLLALSTLLLPTFCMGATIPLLVAVVPETAAEVHLCHAKIYGINTLGAGLGAFGASFVLVPRFGLDGTLLLAAGVNLAVGAAFLLNRLRHAVAKDRPIETVPHRFPIGAVYCYTLVTGMVTLSLEVLFVRVLGLTVGSGPHNFAIVIGVFILGLAAGSLLLTPRLLSVRLLFRSISVLILYLVVLFHSVPYWPYWLSNVRVALASIPVNYTVYLLLTSVFLAVVLLPFLVPLGTMLPLTYALIPKSGTDYARKCGWLYFCNTLGTVLGAVGLSYAFLNWLDLDQVFKLDLLLLTGLALYLFEREKRHKLAAGVGLVAILFLLGPGWDRASHYVGLFHFPTLNAFNFKGWLSKPNLAPEVLFFDDGPDATVTVTRHAYGTHPVPAADGSSRPEPVHSRSLVINGQADGDSLEDLSTNTLAALLPYVHAPERSGLRATIVGLGTGTTAGILGSCEDITHVTAVEISATLVRASPLFDEVNLGLSRNPKVELVATDGFRYFRRIEQRVDIVVSATSQPWVVGVENLFTPEFYRLAHAALTDDGVFFQWFPLYALDQDGFRTILTNIRAVFPELQLYQISLAELGLLAGKQPGAPRLLARRFHEPRVAGSRAALQLDGPELLALIRLYDTRGLGFLAGLGEAQAHTLARPSLAYASDLTRFLNPPVGWDAYNDVRLARLTLYSDERRAAFDAVRRRHPGGLRCSLPALGPQLFCDRFNSLLEAHGTFSRAPGDVPLASQLEAYDTLRDRGVHPADAEFLARVVARLVERLSGEPPALASALESVLATYEKDGLWPDAAGELASLSERGLISPDYHRAMLARLETGRRGREAFAAALRP